VLEEEVEEVEDTVLLEELLELLELEELLVEGARHFWGQLSEHSTKEQLPATQESTVQSSPSSQTKRTPGTH